MAYIGYFRSVFKDKLYSVTINKTGDNSTPKEVNLAGDSPFVVKYNESSTPFEPIRTSTATISIVNDTYMEDIIPNKAQETEVKLVNESDGIVEWVGYLTPKLYSQGYSECNETIEFEAADCISVLQYLDYEPINNHGIVNIKAIIDRICTSAGLINTYFIPLTKKLSSGEYLKFSSLRISEQNFFSSDMEEPWNLQEVLEEICKYMGYTAIQINDKIHFIDYTAFNKYENYTSTSFVKVEGWEDTWPQSSSGVKSNPYTVTEKDIMGRDAEITFEPVYNKIYVNCNLYNCETFIPGIFDDENLTNRNGEYYQTIEISPETPAIASYPYGSSWGSQKYVDEKISDADFKYFHRLYDNKYWESVYRNDTLNPVNPVLALNTSNITKNYIGGTIVDLGTVRKSYFDMEQWDMIVASKMDYQRYLCISQMGKGMDASIGSTSWIGDIDNTHTIFKLKDGYKSNCLVSENAYLVINYDIIFERYKKRNYINPEWAKINNEGHAGFSTDDGDLWFQLKIGDKYWNGKKWTTERTSFRIYSKHAELDDMFNDSKPIVNTVSWELNINEDGYIIPLKGVDLTETVTFKILLPELQNYILYKQNGTPTPEWNNYCWVSDLTIKVVEPNQDVEVLENDLVYENIIDEKNISELDEIDLKITSYTPLTKPSYSNVGLVEGGIFLQEVIEESLSAIPQKPEENIVEKYFSQYSTPTKKITLTLGNNISQLSKIYGCDVDNPNSGYVTLGTEIDYLYDTQTITFVQKK